MRERTLALLLGLMLGLTAASQAAATPFTLFFDGPGGIGVDASLVEAPGFGLSIVEPAGLYSISGALDLIGQVLDQSSIDPLPPTLPSGPNTGQSQWTVQALIELNGSTYLYFRTTDPLTIASTVIEYADANVGLVVDAAAGWVMVKDVVGPDVFYYPAVSLGALAPAEVAAPFTVSYVVNEPLVQSPLPPGEFVYPQLQVGMGFTPIPEPGSGLLVAFGLAGLSAWRRRGS